MEGICPTEDAVQAFLDHLVDPLLPERSFLHVVPPLSLQQSVGKQMHAVVLLYNYYHRKQSPQLEFLRLVSFCKYTVVMKPELFAYMKLTQKSDVAAAKDLEKELSVVEKMVLDACKISGNLNAAKSFPTFEGWPISKVAVLVVDSQKNNCLLKYGQITQGIRSLLESDFDSSNLAAATMMGKKSKSIPQNPSRDVSIADEVVLKQLAFSAVKKEIEISDADLNVLESHTVYSHTKEKEAARFYIIQNMQSARDGWIQVPIKEAIESLQGPLLKTLSHRWVVSPVVEYFHLLPYAGIISDWFSRRLSSEGLHNKRIGLVSEKADIVDREQTSCQGNREESRLTSDLVGVFDKGTSRVSNELREGSTLQFDFEARKQRELNQSSGVNFAVVKDNYVAKTEIPQESVNFFRDGDSNCRNSLEAKSIQMHDMEDENALCEQKIQNMQIGGKDEWSVKSLIEGFSSLSINCSSNEKDIGPRNDQPMPHYSKEDLSKIQDPCQELDALCSANNWKLPTYHESTSDGGFQATITIKETDFECLTYGDIKPSPHEARASAATGLLTIYKKIASQAQ